MGSFIGQIAEISSKDKTVIDFANFYHQLHIEIGCEDQGCNFFSFVQDLISAVKENVSVEERKNPFADCRYYYRDIIKPLLFCVSIKNIVLS